MNMGDSNALMSETDRHGIVTTGRVIKLGIATSALVVVGLGTLPKVEGYSASIYWQIPAALKIAGSFIIAGSILATIAALYTGRRQVALVSTLPYLTVFAVFPFIPQVMGYVIKFGDVMNHVGFVKFVLTTGDIPSGVIYPALHITTAVLAEMTGIGPETLLNMFGALTVLSIPLMLLLLSRLTSVPPAASILLVSLLVSPTMATPSAVAWSVLFLLVLYLGFRLIAAPSRLHHPLFGLTTLLMSALLFWHPVAMFFELIGFALIVFSSYIKSDNSRKTRQTVFDTAVLIGILAFLWAASTSLLTRFGHSISALLFGIDAPTSTLGSDSLFTTLFDTFGLSLVDFFAIALQKFGNIALVAGIAGVGVILYYSQIGPKVTTRQYYLPLAAALLVVFSGMWSILEVTVGIISQFNFRRVLQAAMYGGLFVGGTAIFVAIHAMRRSTKAERYGRTGMFVALAIVLIVSSATLGGALLNVSSAYDSPSKLQANRETLPSDMEGMSWYFENKARDTDTTTLWSFNWRYVNYLLPPDEAKRRNQELDGNAQSRDYRAPAHFGYPNNSTLLETVGCTYYRESIYDRKTYTVARPGNTFVRSDFERLQTDQTVSRIYTNRNINISKVGSC